jgi:ribA/ribD-fused uncharacterized protein
MYSTAAHRKFNLLTYVTRNASVCFKVFQALKFITVAPDIAEKIRSQRDPLDAMRKAKEYERHQRPDWSAVKIDVMYDVLRRKFYQHPQLQQELARTGTRRLIENSKASNMPSWAQRV